MYTFFINPFSSDVISPTLHYVLNLNEEVKLTNRSTNELEHLQVNWFSSWVVHTCSYITCP